MIQVEELRSKYNARKTEVDGIKFDSMREADRYLELRMLESAGRIKSLVLQPDFVLQEAFTDNQGTRRRAIRYRADFMYRENGVNVVEDVKGARTQVFNIKMKMFLKRYPQYELRLT